MKWFEYALNVYDDKDEFLEQIDCFSTIKEAKKYIKENPLDEGESYKIIRINYERKHSDGNIEDNEIGIEVVYET